MPNEEAEEQTQFDTLLAQILAETFNAVSDHPTFDEDTLKRLRELAASDRVKDSEQVINCLHPKGES